MKSLISPSRGVLRPKQVRGNNNAIVLQLLRRASRISRAELARLSGLSEGTVSRIVAGLLSQSLVVEEGAENSTGGRPATQLHLSEEPKAIGVEIQNWETRFALSTMRGTLTDRTSMRTPPSPEQTVARIVEQSRQYCAEHGRKRIHGLGVCARGLVNAHTGVVEIGNAPGWTNVPLRRMLEDALRMPVYVDNDVRVAATAEYNYTESGKSAPHCLLYVRVGEGVGISVFLDGELYTGPSMGAGEFGQMVIADDGGNMTHDRPGCLEKLISNSAVCARYAAAAGRAASGTADSGARVRRICQQAMAGDAVARQVLETTGRFLGIGIANLVWGLAPEVVVIGSSLNTAWPIIREAILRQFPNPADWPSFRGLSIERSALDDQGVLTGAATLAFAPFFRPE
ncbi:MAG TPA: ROK family protein [Bryobacteraceae bacterium]|nr:ROK family protein [Bryobacteraceae bacterium]